MAALTIGMPTYDDFHGVYFTIQALRLYQDLEDTELVVVDNYGCEHTRDFVENWAHGRYILATDVTGTAAAKNRVLEEAEGDAVLCCDSHVLFAPGVIARLKQYYRDHPDTIDLLQGPLVYDDLESLSTHFDPVWSGNMWGVWATDPRGLDPEGEPFEIPMLGMGAFSCRKAAWRGFNPAFRGFGGEEGYIHEKFRQAGARCLCLPWFRWVHRFERPAGVPYPLNTEDKLRNYVIGFTELGLDLTPVLEHFAEDLPEETIATVTEQALRQGISGPPSSHGAATPVASSSRTAESDPGATDELQRAYSWTSVTQRDEWDPVLQAFGGTAMQSWRWGQLLQRLGYDVERIRVDGPHGIGLAQIVIEDLGSGTTAHLPRGPVIVGQWLPVARQLFEAIDEVAARYSAVSVTVEPDAPLPADAAYAKLGFKAASQPYYSHGQTVKVPLLDDQALLKQMRSATRNKVRLAQRRGIRVTEHTRADSRAMTTFYALLEDTGRRNEFEIDGRSYYDDSMAVFDDDGALLLAHVGETPIAGAIVLRILNEGVYMFGASSTAQRVAGATQYLQFEAMRWARSRGCMRYDLWGVPAEESSFGRSQRSRGDDMQGIRHFKIGFGGDIVTYPPAWERRIRRAAASAPVRVDETVALTVNVSANTDTERTLSEGMTAPEVHGGIDLIDGPGFLLRTGDRNATSIAARNDRLPLVSCICPTYNRPPTHQHLLEEAVESFLRQTYPNKELIVLNDCPGQELFCNAPGVRVVNASERFPSLGEKYNAAIDLAHGTLIAPWEDDDISLPWRLSVSVNRLGDGDYFNPGYYWLMDSEGLHSDHPRGYGHNLSLFTRAAWEAVGGYPPISGAQDAQIDALLLAHVGCVGEEQLARSEWYYIYRWGISPAHLSGQGSSEAFYREFGERPIQAGRFVLRPHWDRDYEAETRRLVGPPHLERRRSSPNGRASR